MTEYTMLPEKENFKRLQDCDFNTIVEYETNKIQQSFVCFTTYITNKYRLRHFLNCNN